MLGDPLPSAARPTFSLEIHSLEEFAAFFALLRGERVDPAQLQELTTRLAQATQALATATAQAAPANPPTT